MVQHVDILICGSGSAGLCAATWLARCGISCKILEKNSGPMQLGQADGVQCRTVEVFESFGLAEELLKQGYHVLEVAFWSSGEGGGLVRTRKTADTMPGLSHQPHVILNQAKVNGFLLDAMRRENGQGVDYGVSVKDVKVDVAADAVKTNGTLTNGTHPEVNGITNGISALANEDEYPVTVTTERDGVEEVFKAKYALVSHPGYRN
jgi:phenol 2-monooxygenase